MDSLKLSRTHRMLYLAIAVALVVAGCGGRGVNPEQLGGAGSPTDSTATSAAGSEVVSDSMPNESEPPVTEPGADSNGESDQEPETTSEATPVSQPPNPDCVPEDVEGNPIVQPDRRHEDIIFYLTGERQTGDLDPVEETIDDPNFGGVWGDFAGGIVVAVLDCSAVDTDEIARIAGGPQYLHLIEVSHTFREVDSFRDDLAGELRSLGVQAELPIDSTLTGRHITVQLPDPSVLPDDFGSGVPDHLFSIVEGGLAVEQ